MRRIYIWASAIAALSISVFAQSAEFGVADVHASPPGTFAHVAGGMTRGGIYELHSATMLDLIRTAWKVDADKVVGGPSWLDTNRYEVIAKTDPATAADAMPGMLQKLLADRFSLVVHTDTRPVPALALTAGKRPRLKAATDAGDAGCEPRQNAQASPGTPQNVTIACHNIAMADFAARISGMTGTYITQSVIDATNLKGRWNFNLTWNPKALKGEPDPDLVTFSDAVNRQLGLKLEPRNVPMPVLVVDKVNEMPTPNAPDVTQKLPAAAAHFEVAEIKPSAPGEAPGGGFRPGGLVDLHAISLKQLMLTAWAVSDDMIVDAPKWMSTNRFDIVARAPSAPQAVSAVGVPVDMDAMRMMLRALILDRFRMTVHNEERPMPVYALLQTKSRLKQADNSTRAGCKQNVAARGDAGNAVPVSTYSCQGTTMAQFAGRLRQITGGEVNHPVVDATGLNGAWDFDLTWSPPPRLSAAPQTPDTAVAPPDPVGGASLTEALDKQLGLKLELQKRPTSVLVIDHVDEKPTDN